MGKRCGRGWELKRTGHCGALAGRAAMLTGVGSAKLQCGYFSEEGRRS